MTDLLHIKDTSWYCTIILTLVSGTLSVAILSKQSDIDIPLIIFTAFEWLSSICSIINLVFIHFKIIPNKIFYVNFFNRFCVIASTTLGIYWIDNIILKNLTVNNLNLRQLKLSFITIFIVSVLFKSVIFLNVLLNNSLISNINDEDPSPSDLESGYATTYKESVSNIPSVITHSIPSTNSVIKLKSSLQTLVSKQEMENTIKSPIIKNPQNILENSISKPKEACNQLNLQCAELFNIPSRCETTVTTDNSNGNLNTNQFQNLDSSNILFRKPQLLNHVNLENNIPLMLKAEEIPNNNVNKNHDINDSVASVVLKPSSFQFPRHDISQINGYHNSKCNLILDEKNNQYDEDREIQMLNICEPINIPDFSENVKFHNNSIKNISLKTWNENLELVTNEHAINSQNLFKRNLNSDIIGAQEGQNKSEYHQTFFSNNNKKDNSLDIQSLGSEFDNCLFDELNKEIRENGSHQSQIQLQQSMPNLKFNSKNNSVVRRGGSFSKVIRGSMSSSNINNRYVKNKSSYSSLNLNITHQKSNSLSAISMSKTKSRSRSHSPLKRFRSFKDNLQLTPRNSKHISEAIAPTSDDFELDLNIANLIRKSPKKKTSIRSITSKSGIRRMSVTSPTRNDLIVPLQDLSSSSPISLGNDFSLSFGEISPSIQAKIREKSPFNNKKHFKDSTDEFFSLNRMKNQRVFSAVSSTNKSSISNNSVPSGYYGEYDKEKWRVFKKVHNDQFFSPPLTTTP
ncbi:hypothetical protein C6P40_004511 [Pichia californica]|uniref:Uncharacterized protein n=1 Tax=Pichia californica TaxID=460514 RepID=A0A9P6WMP8_9ASCO|nr:hypothetical protein C6P40_004511 [[Candida] californica]